MVLIILILPILVLLFLFFLSHVPKSIKPTSFKSTFNSFYLFLVLLASLFSVLNHEDTESPTNKVAESYQDQDDIGVNDESHFYDAEDWPMSDEAVGVAVNSDDQRTSTPPPVPWIHVNYNKLDRQVNEDTTERGSSDNQSYRNWKRKLHRRKVKNIRRVAPYIPPAPPPQPPAPASPPPPNAQAQAPSPAPGTPPAPALAPVPDTTPTPFIKNLKKIFTPKNKNKKHPSSKTSKLPPRLPQQPEPQHYELNSSSSSTSQSSCTPPPARPRPTPHPQPEPEPRHYDRQSSMSTRSQSSYIPEPPPLPPFDMPEMKYRYYGDFVRLRSYNSNTSSSPDIQPMGQPSTAIYMDSGDMLWSSPDVNAKASIFISKGKDKWTMEQENTQKKKGGPSFVNSIFMSGNKNKKLPSSQTSPLPQLPPTGSRPQPRPPPQTKPQPQHYYRQSSTSSSSQSSYIPRPPPLPPFDVPAMRYKYIGDHFARLRSFNSNTSSSPDLQPMGQPSTSMDGGDMLWSSPDVNTKAGIFISKGKDKWKMEQENTVKKNGGTSLMNKPRKPNLNPMKSHLYP